MGQRYTRVEGLQFPKGSDREYIEEWNKGISNQLIRKSVKGEEIIYCKSPWNFTIKGSGDRLPECRLNVGNIISVHPNYKMRFEKWNYTYEPWKFCYTWSYSFIQVEG